MRLKLQKTIIRELQEDVSSLTLHYLNLQQRIISLEVHTKAPIVCLKKKKKGGRT